VPHGVHDQRFSGPWEDAQSILRKYVLDTSFKTVLPRVPALPYFEHDSCLIDAAELVLELQSHYSSAGWQLLLPVRNSLALLRSVRATDSSADFYK
jgi:hypothetical protein